MHVCCCLFAVSEQRIMSCEFVCVRCCFSSVSKSSAFYHLLTEFVWFSSLSSRCRFVLLVAAHISLPEFVVLWPGWVGAFFFFLR